MSFNAGQCLSLCFALIVLPSIAIAQNPNQAETTNWYKGNLHTHSLWSDGNDFPEMIAKWYSDNNYHFLALTDHNIVSDHEKWMSVDKIVERGGPEAIDKLNSAFGPDWIERRVHGEEEQIRLKRLSEFRRKFEKPNQFLMMVGEEISDSVAGLPLHMNATNLKTVIQPSSGKTMVEAINNNLRVVMEQSKKIGEPILVHLNHPNYGWAVTAEDIAQVTNEQFFEVYNAHPAINHLGDKDRPSIERMWDIANTIRIDQLKAKPLFGLATDDSHHYHGKGNARSGRGWIMVRSEELSPKKILNSMYQGDFYCSSGVEFSRLNISNNQIEINMVPRDGVSYKTEFIGTPRNYDRSTEKAAVIKNKKGEPMRISRVYSSDVGRVLDTVEGNSAIYRFQGSELYVRAVVTSSEDHPDPSFEDQKRQAWTQPVVVQKR